MKLPKAGNNYRKEKALKGINFCELNQMLGWTHKLSDVIYIMQKKH
jgi:hypothetical protein